MQMQIKRRQNFFNIFDLQLPRGKTEKNKNTKQQLPAAPRMKGEEENTEGWAESFYRKTNPEQPKACCNNVHKAQSTKHDG